jgi:hypothetical protein
VIFEYFGLGLYAHGIFATIVDDLPAFDAIVSDNPSGTETNRETLVTHLYLSGRARL